MTVEIEIIAKRISEIKIAISNLSKYATLNVDDFISDEEKVAAAKYHLLIMIEGCISICTHIAAKDIHKIPEGYGACFQLLAENKVLGKEFSRTLSKMAGFRNLLIHQYWDICDKKVHKFISSGIADVKKYIKIIGNKYVK